MYFRGAGDLIWECYRSLSDVLQKVIVSILFSSRHGLQPTLSSICFFFKVQATTSASQFITILYQILGGKSRTHHICPNAAIDAHTAHTQMPMRKSDSNKNISLNAHFPKHDRTQIDSGPPFFTSKNPHNSPRKMGRSRHKAHFHCVCTT